LVRILIKLNPVNKLNAVVFFPLGDSPASEIFAPTFEKPSETSAQKIQALGNYKKERIQHLQHDGILKPRH
jgi:hypothetical protein